MKKHMLAIAIAVVAFIAGLACASRAQIAPAPAPTNHLYVSPPPMIPPRPRQPTGPYRTYAPRDFQRIGVISAPGEQTLPLMARRTPAHNSRFNYYTLTEGNQAYPLVIRVSGRDCTEDIGCDEMYGTEEVEVVGKPGVVYTPHVYRI